MAEVLEAYHPLPLDGKSPPQTAEHLPAQTCVSRGQEEEK